MCEKTPPPLDFFVWDLKTVWQLFLPLYMVDWVHSRWFWVIFDFFEFRAPLNHLHLVAGCSDLVQKRSNIMKKLIFGRFLDLKITYLPRSSSKSVQITRTHVYFEKKLILGVFSVELLVFKPKNIKKMGIFELQIIVFFTFLRKKNYFVERQWSHMRKSVGGKFSPEK